jgi:hypothetical protein
MRTAGPGGQTYDIAIDSISASNSLHALVDPPGTHPDLQGDADHLYFAVAGKGADGSNPYNASYDDGQTNYFNTMEARTTPYTSATSRFVLSGLAIDPSDTLSFALVMDSRNDKTLAAGLAGYQTQFVNFAAARAYSASIGSLTDRETFPWDIQYDPTPVDANNFPIWLTAINAPDEYPAGAVHVTRPIPNCDGYTGDASFSLPGSLFTSLSGQPDGSSITFTETLKSDTVIVCEQATSPTGPNNVPNAMASATVTFRATVHQNPWPDLSGNICSPSELTPVPLGGAPDWAWVGEWSDPDSEIEVNIWPDKDQGLDVQVTEAQTACGTNAPLAPIYANATGLTDYIPIIPDWAGTVASPCVSQPANPGVKKLFQIPYAQSLALYSSGKVWLELFTYTCSGSNQPRYKVRYTRDVQPNVLADYMLDLRPKLQ